MTCNTADVSHIAEFGWFGWVMFHDNEPSYPDNKLVLGHYLGPAINTGLALTAKILKSNGVFICTSAVQHLNDEELNRPIHQEIQCKFDKSIKHHLGPVATPQDFPVELDTRP
jgi:hypothetical protein